MRKLMWFLISVGLAGCSTYSKTECASMDWRRQGADFAVKGETLDEIKSHFAEKCERKHGISANDQMLEGGYRQGIESLCTTAGAQELAESGGVYKGTCAGAREAQFLAKYHTVREAHLEGKIRDLESKLSSLNSENDRLESQIRGLEGDLRSCRSMSH